MIDKIEKKILIIGLIFLVMGICLTIWNSYRAEDIDRREDEVKISESFWDTSSPGFNYKAMELRIKNLEEELKYEEELDEKIAEKLLVEKAIRADAEVMVEKLVDYVVYMHNLADVNGIEYIPFDY